MNKRFLALVVLNYDLESGERSEAEMEAENRLINRLGDDLVVVKRLEENSVGIFETEV